MKNPWFLWVREPLTVALFSRPTVLFIIPQLNKVVCVTFTLFSVKNLILIVVKEEIKAPRVLACYCDLQNQAAGTWAGSTSHTHIESGLDFNACSLMWCNFCHKVSMVSLWAWVCDSRCMLVWVKKFLVFGNNNCSHYFCTRSVIFSQKSHFLCKYSKNKSTHLDSVFKNISNCAEQTPNW